MVVREAVGKEDAYIRPGVLHLLVVAELIELRSESFYIGQQVVDQDCRIFAACGKLHYGRREHQQRGSEDDRHNA